MSGMLALLRIETRRSVAVWFVPLIVLLGWYISDDASYNGVRLWGELRTQLGFATITIVPVAGAVAAWVAGRERRRGIGEALRPLPAPAFARDVAAWGAAAFWSVLAYLGVAGGRVVQTALDATWGRPDLAGIGIGVTAIAAASAFGYLVGVLVPSRFAAVLAAGALALGENQIDRFTWSNDSIFQNLSPWAYLYFWGNELDSGSDPYGWALLLWLGGIAAVLLAAVGLLRVRSRGSWGAFAAGVLLASFGAAAAIGFGSGAWTVAAESGWRDAPQVCVEATIPVCVHPAYERFLDETATIVVAVVAPMVGIPGAPSRAVHFEVLRSEPDDDMLQIGVVIPEREPDRFAWDVAAELVGSYGAANPSPVQLAVAYWLSVQAGYDPGSVGDWISFQADCVDWERYSDSDPEPHEPVEIPGCRAEFEEAIARFGRIPEAEKRAWLERHFAELRAGGITVEELP